MRKRIFPIWSVLLVLAISIAVLLPGCEGGGVPTAVTIEIKALLYDVEWEGSMNYTLTPLQGTPISGTRVPDSFAVNPGTWSFDYVSGGPPDSVYVGGFWWELGESEGGIIGELEDTIVADLGDVLGQPVFEFCEDARIEFLHWTQNGEILQEREIFAIPCNTIDAHFKQRVPWCNPYDVTMNEESWLSITQTSGPAAQIVVVDDWCAVGKTPAPREKVSQLPSIDGEIVEKGLNITLVPQISTELDVHTQWVLEGNVDYTKNIDWFGISVGSYEPDVHPCVLFELILPDQGFVYTFELITSAKIEVVNDTDSWLDNNEDTSEPLTLTVDLS